MKRQNDWIMLCALLLAGAARAAETAPASQPVSQPATTMAADTVPAVAANYSTPVEAAKTYMRAMFAGKSAAIHDALLVPDDRKGDIDALISLTVAQHGLQEEAARLFKGDGDRLFYGDPKKRVPLADQLKTVDDAALESAGDAATLTLAAADATSPPQKITLKKIGDAWKLDAVALYSLDSPKAAAQVELARKLTAVTNETLKDLTSGKFSSASEAYQEYWMRMAEASKATATTEAGH